MARRILLPDLYAAHSFGGYLEGVLAARRAAGQAGSLAALATAPDHFARSVAGAARRMHDLNAVHAAAGSPPTSPGLSRPVLLLTHTTLAATLEP